MNNISFDLVVLDTDFKAIHTLDEYESLIWTERYNACGDFELYTLFEQSLLDVLQPDYYLINKESEYVMIIEDIKIEANVEDGAKLIVTGRSLESILDRRIVWKQTNLNAKLETAVGRLFNDAIISPTDENRQIDNFVFLPSEDPKIERCKLDHQYTGDNLYDIMGEICEEFLIGYKITLSEDWEFLFQFYSGLDRTDRQFNNRQVYFSPKLDNLVSSNYEESNSNYKTVALVAGEGEGNARKTEEVGNLSIVGLYRRELFVDSRNVSSNSETSISAAQYTKLLEAEGEEALSEHRVKTTFDGQIEETAFQYREDYCLGDIVEMENEYGHKGIAQVTEFIFSVKDNAIERYPTLSGIDDDLYYDITTEKLTPAMTGRGDLTTTGQITGSDWYRSGSPESYTRDWWKAFDEVKTTYWLTRNTDLYINKPDWVQFQWPNGERVVPLVVKGIGGFTSRNNAVAKIEIYVEDDFGDMILVGEQENTKKATAFGIDVTLEEEIKTNKVKIVIYSAYASYTGLREIEIFGRR